MRISDWSSDVFSSDLVQQSGIELVSELKEREAEAIDLARSLNLPEVSAVFWFSSTSIKADPFVAGRKGAPGYLMDKLGIENVIESDEDWPTVGWESIAKSDTTVIVIAQVDRRRFPADDVDKKLAFLNTDSTEERREGKEMDSR